MAEVIERIWKAPWTEGAWDKEKIVEESSRLPDVDFCGWHLFPASSPLGYNYCKNVCLLDERNARCSCYAPFKLKDIPKRFGPDRTEDILKELLEKGLNI